MSKTEELNSIKKNIWDILAAIPDPEIPVLTILDLGIVRDIKINSSYSGDKDFEVDVMITPTYTGCPAMDMIATHIKLALEEKGYKEIKITSVLSPPWTTEWITEEGKEKLKQYGIAPPLRLSDQHSRTKIQCPHCNSFNTQLISAFGSTPCKALYQCNDCQEPFDYFKCH